MVANRKTRLPWIAAALNFIFLGAGYLYLRKRKVFGWLMIGVFVIMTAEYFISDINHLRNIANTHSVSLTLLSVALAVDAYILAKE